VITLLLLAELGVRAAAPKLRDPLLWPDWEAQHKVAAMDRLAERGGASVVFVGSSMVNAGIDPALMTRVLGEKRPAFNGALNGADMRVIEAWTRNAVVPRLRPRIVVIGFNTAETNDARESTDLYDAFVASPLGRVASEQGGVLARVDSWLIEHSYLARYRRVLRHPVDAIVGHDAAEDRQRVGPLGRLLVLNMFQTRPYTSGLAGQLGNFNRAFANYSVGGPQLRALERLVRSLREQSIGVVLVRMPVTPDVIPRHTAGQADRDELTRTLSAFVRRNRLQLLDMDARFPSTSLFVDPVHLNAEGMEMLTSLVAEELKKDT
jgi:hypothetical protein